jgi:hypothetical protein
LIILEEPRESCYPFYKTTLSFLKMAFGKSEPFRWYNFWICFAVAVGTVAFGYPSAIIGSTLGKAAFLEYMGLGDADGVFPSKQGLTGAITGVFQVIPGLSPSTDRKVE